MKKKFIFICFSIILLHCLDCCRNSSVTEGMVLIPEGFFEMGDHFSEGDDDEKPVHRVFISEFYMDEYEVTNEEYKECVDGGGCKAPKDSGSHRRSSYYGEGDYKNYPVIYVDWNNANSYCSWKGKRLPTEAEWEYAARGGLKDSRYPNGDNISGSDANFWNSGDSEDNDTTEVGSYPANGYGLHDMSGNVSEWCYDYYDKNYYNYSPPIDPKNWLSIINMSSRHVARGGSWNSKKKNIRVADRTGDDPLAKYYDRGFRCVR